MLPVMTIIVFHPYIYQTVGCKVFNDSTFAMRVKRPKHVQMDLQKKTYGLRPRNVHRMLEAVAKRLPILFLFFGDSHRK